MTNAIRAIDGFGSVSGVPKLPMGFSDVFQSHRVEANGIGLHAVIGGEGPPLLLLGGSPQNWVARRYLMLPLSRDFTVVAVDPRGVGLSDKPAGGYDETSWRPTCSRLWIRLAMPNSRWSVTTSACGSAMQWLPTARTVSNASLSAKPCPRPSPVSPTDQD
jgi:hypothetical protein